MISRFYRFTVLLAGLALGAVAHAGDVQVDGAWVRATPPGRDAASVFMYIASKQDATLRGASSPVAKTVEMRTMEHKGGMMKTLTLDSIPLPAGKRVDMTSIHGYHLTLTGLTAPLEAGGTVPLTLDVEMPGKQRVTVGMQAEIRPLKNAPQKKEGADHSRH